MFDDLEQQKASRDQQNQIDWYAEQALENEAAARRLDTVCERALRHLEEVWGAADFETAMDRLMKARQLLRNRHQQSK